MKRPTTTRTVELNGTAYTFTLKTRKNGYGFTHLCYLSINGKAVRPSRVNWQNRTWELFDYQQAMLKAVSQEIERRTLVIKNHEKRINDWNTLTDARKATLEQAFARHERLQELHELHKAISDGTIER